jgi:SAM-dependent methyltransferase
MFLGTRDLFTYAECGRCGSLELRNPPDLDRYYLDADYRPLQKAAKPTFGSLERLIRVLVTEVRLRIMRDYHHWTYALRLAGASRRSHVLDVGCGSGALLRHLYRNGFQHLTGIDPYTRASTNGVTIINGTLDTYDGGLAAIIMMNDSLEHVPDPLTTLTQAREHLSPGGRLIVRLPLAGTFCWRAYGACWVQLDAPRHLHVPTEIGVKTIAKRVGLEVVTSFHDSTEFGFWGSELYKRDIPLVEGQAIFSNEQIENWKQLAEQLNERRDGDHATFILSAE